MGKNEQLQRIPRAKLVSNRTVRNVEEGRGSFIKS